MQCTPNVRLCTGTYFQWILNELCVRRYPWRCIATMHTNARADANDFMNWHRLSPGGSFDCLQVPASLVGRIPASGQRAFTTEYDTMRASFFRGSWNSDTAPSIVYSPDTMRQRRGGGGGDDLLGRLWLLIKLEFRRKTACCLP